jgi:hypothetical protein
MIVDTTAKTFPRIKGDVATMTSAAENSIEFLRAEEQLRQRPGDI